MNYLTHRVAIGSESLAFGHIIASLLIADPAAQMPRDLPRHAHRASPRSALGAAVFLA